MKKLLLTGLLLFTGSAFAQQGAFHDGPCKKDRETYCTNVQAGEGRIIKCMKENEEKLSAECKAAWAKTKEELKDVKEACHEDAQKFCSGLKQKELAKCLRTNKDKLSESCKSEFKELRATRKGK